MLSFGQLDAILAQVVGAASVMGCSSARATRGLGGVPRDLRQGSAGWGDVRRAAAGVTCDYRLRLR